MKKTKNTKTPRVEIFASAKPETTTYKEFLVVTLEGNILKRNSQFVRLICNYTAEKSARKTFLIAQDSHDFEARGVPILDGGTES